MRKLLIFSLALAMPAGVYASGVGTTAASFLKVSMSPRALAMAGAFGALADDSGAVFINPAGLAQSDKREVGLGFTNYLQGAKMGNLSYAGTISGNRFGFGASFLNVGDIERRGLNDNAGAVSALGSFDSNDLAVTLAYAKKEFMPDSLPGLDAGCAVKFINSSIDSKNASAVALFITPPLKSTCRFQCRTWALK